MVNKGTQKQRSEEFKNFQSLPVWMHMPILYTACAYVNMYTYIPQSTAAVQTSAVISVLNSSECSDIPKRTKTQMCHENNRSWASLPVPWWEFAMNTRRNRSQELASSLYPDTTQPCQKFADFDKILVDLPRLVGTRSWDMKLLKSSTSEIWCFTAFWRVCTVNHLPLKRSHPAKHQIPVLEHKAFKTLRDQTTRILNLGRTIPSLVC